MWIPIDFPPIRYLWFRTEEIEFKKLKLRNWYQEVWIEMSKSKAFIICICHFFGSKTKMPRLLLSAVLIGPTPEVYDAKCISTSTEKSSISIERVKAPKIPLKSPFFQVLIFQSTQSSIHALKQDTETN